MALAPAAAAAGAVAEVAVALVDAAPHEGRSSECFLGHSPRQSGRQRCLDGLGLKCLGRNLNNSAADNLESLPANFVAAAADGRNDLCSNHRRGKFSLELLRRQGSFEKNRLLFEWRLNWSFGEWGLGEDNDD